MIDRHTFYVRKAICERCAFWKNKCLKGHTLQSPVGCPVNNFPPVQGAGVLPDAPVPVTQPVPCGTCVPDGTLKPVRWPEAMAQFQEAMARWQAAGRPTVDSAAHNRRLEVCKRCPGGHYHWFQCKLCKSLVFIKAKLPTETCPAGYWPRS